uniref:MCP four helix bundle domain-containing protein n=2 Tax=Rheinheimera sp. TaxID=1869214 RepID=UPI0040481A30
MQDRKSMTVAMRLGLGFGVILLLMVALTLFGMQRVNQINQTLTQITEVNSVKQRYAINFRGSVHDRAIALRDVTLVPELSALSPILADINRLQSFYQQSRQPMDQLFADMRDIDPAERKLLEAIHQVERRALPLSERVVTLRQQGQQNAAQQLLLNDMSPAYVDWLASINAFIDYQEQKNQKATDYARGVASGFALSMVLLTVLAILIGAMTAWYISRYLRKALGGEPDQAADIVSRIASGDLTTQIADSQPNSMLAAVATMQRQLRQTLKEVIAAATTVSAQSTELDVASKEALQASELQASSSTASAASIEQMTVSLSAVSNTVQLTERNSEKTAELSAQGARLVQMETSAPRVSQGLALANQAAAMLEQIRLQAEDSLHNVRDVSRSTNEQTAAVSELAKHIEQIASMSRETAVVMQQNRGVVSALQQVATSLSKQVSRFKTD